MFADRGTEGLSAINDWKNNFAQFLGFHSAQYEDALSVGKQVSAAAESRGVDLVFTGHSLGGGLAAAQAVATHRKALVFDAAWVNPRTLNMSRSEFSQARDKYVDYIFTKGDALTDFQSGKGAIAKEMLWEGNSCLDATGKVLSGAELTVISTINARFPLPEDILKGDYMHAASLVQNGPDMPGNLYRVPSFSVDASGRTWPNIGMPSADNHDLYRVSVGLDYLVHLALSNPKAYKAIGFQKIRP